VNLKLEISDLRFGIPFVQFENCVLGFEISAVPRKYEQFGVTG
jgi:hypothetical protein